jgi:ferrous iron transport protein A
MPTLAELKLGQRARVEGIQGADALSQRLMEMGLLEGEKVELIAVAPLGDPLEIRLNDCRLSLRKAEAARVQIAYL